MNVSEFYSSQSSKTRTRFEFMRWVKAKYKDEDFLSRVNTLSVLRDAVHIWWLGQSGYLLQWNSIHVLIDPYLSDSLTKKYAGTNKPHERISEQVIDPSRLDFIDIVTSSHNHTDHLDGETLIPIIAVNSAVKMVIPEANREFVSERIKMPLSFPEGLNENESININGIKFHGIPAAHNELERDENGRCRFMGYVIEIGGKKIYHSGDTLLFPGMEDILRPFNVDLAILPINGNDPSRGVAGNLNASEAVWLAKQIQAKLTIPFHYDLFSFNTVDVSVFIEEAKKMKIPFKVLEPGEGLSL